MKSFITVFVSILILQQTTYAQMEFKKNLPVRKDKTVDTYFGKKINDPYRWLEDDNSQETKSWVEMQNAVTQDYLQQIPIRKQIHTQLTQLWNYAKYSSPFKEGENYLFYKNDGLQNQAVLYIQKGLTGEPSVFIDPNKLNDKGTAALGSLSFSKNHKYCAYNVSQAGSDWQEIFVMEVETKKIISDKIEYSKFSNIAWLGEEGFYYSGYDKPKNENEKFSAKTEYQKIYFHQLGTPQASDKLIYEDKQHPLMYKSVGISDDERWLMMSLSEGTDGSELMYWDREDKTQTTFKLLVKGFSTNCEFVDNIEGQFLINTNDGAPNYKLVHIDPKNIEKENWKTFIPEKKEKLDNIGIVGGHIFCSYLKDASSKIDEYDSRGNFIKTIQLPGIGTASGFGGKKEDNITFYSYSSFNTPNTIYKYDISTGTSELFKAPEVRFPTNNMVVEQEWFVSKDGTRVPMFLFHRKDVNIKSGTHPVLMYGYGGFNISLTPSFSIPNYYFVQKGGVYAMVNLRGGSEYGEDWHKAGMLEKKQNVFDDFIGAAEHLIKKGITTSEQLAIHGRSNGGLLVGACMTQRPDLFKVALPGVGVLDMLRYHKFTVGWGWAVEYGSSDKKEDFNYLIKYSPLHNIIKGTNYPHTLITTADHDDRVVPAHSFKFAATLQEYNSGKNPCLIRIDTQAGHGAGKPTSKQIDEWADVLSFTMYNLGMRVFE
jgi:prolyl oligopeptidase